MIDTYCHLDVAAFDADRDEVIARAGAAGVTGMLIPAIRPRTWAALDALARRHEAAGVRFAIGMPPTGRTASAWDMATPRPRPRRSRRARSSSGRLRYAGGA